MVVKHSGMTFLLLILSISGGFRLTLTETLSLPSNVTQVVGTNVYLQCVGAAISSSNNPISWMKDRKRTVIYNGQTQSNLDSSKYSVETGNNSLTVMNVQLTDATMYCCTKGLVDYCSNVVVIDSLTAWVTPSNGVEVGGDVNLTCSLSYNAPPTDVDYPFPLSIDQDPQLTMWIGQNQIPKDMTGELIVGNPTVPHSKTLYFNRIVAREDVGKNLTCKVSSTRPQFQKQTSVKGGFRLTGNQTKSLRNVTTSLGSTNIIIVCRSDSMNSTNQPSWFKYDNEKIVIYNATSSSNSNSSKYLVDTGNNTLTVMNVQLSDAVTYCCNVGGLVDYCSNVVIIGSVMTYVRPSNLVEIGDIVTLNCSLSYNAPTSDLDAPFPLSRDQQPRFSMFIGEEEIFAAQFVDVETIPHRKTMSVNRTIEVADLDRSLKCRFSSTEPYSYTATLAQIASLGIAIIYPRNSGISQNGYSVNDVFECIAERFPFLEVTWTDVTTPKTPRIISTAIGNATAKVLAAGNYVWTCSIPSPLKTRTVSQKISFTARDPSVSRGNKGYTGIKASLPDLFTAGCVLFIASTIISL